MNDLVQRLRAPLRLLVTPGISAGTATFDEEAIKQRIEAADHIEAQNKTIAEMTKALVFYSHEPIYKFRNVTRSCGCCSDMLEPEILSDEGAIAREILSKSNPNTPERNDE